MKQDIFAFCISVSDISLPSSYLSISWRHNTESMKFLSYTSKLIVVDKILQLQLQIETLKCVMNRKQKT